MDDSPYALPAGTPQNGQSLPARLASGIIGRSPATFKVFEQIEVVAPTNATVLIEGETGTGKELVARSIHFSSRRSQHAFVKVNCSAIPAGLLESELFGHERGAFTGAVTRRAGRLESANHGTLFLDEVGDIPLELQPKLLRVLQEQQFERLGSTSTTRVNVRLLAATNRNLQELVADNQFRRDLFYRLRVFPIHIPPLRDRRDDVPLLVRHFVDRFSLGLRKRVTTIPDDAMNVMVQWHWPGNVRELENFIERCVILTPGNVLHVPVNELLPHTEAHRSLPHRLAELEKEHIVRVLRETNGVVAGPNGAAARLGMKRTTLAARISRLGIVRK